MFICITIITITDEYGVSNEQKSGFDDDSVEKYPVLVYNNTVLESFSFTYSTIQTK